LVRALCVPFAAAAVAIGLAAPAAAADNDYLETLQPRLTFLSPSQLMAAGDEVCRVIHAGAPSSAAVDRLSRDMGVSVPVAFEIVSAAVIHLGC
jgi:Flp pilus assembly protein TadB